jgi:nucleoside-diphosphate-sugar epimerase
MRRASVNDFAAAADCFVRAFHLVDDHREKALCALRGSQAFHQLGHERRAYAWLLRAEFLASDSDADDLLLNVGHAWVSLGNDGNAQHVLRRVLDRDPRSRVPSVAYIRALAWFQLARISLAGDAPDYETAERQLQACIDLQIDDVSPHALLVYATELSGRLPSLQVEEMLRRAVDYDHPDVSPRAAVELGRFYRHVGSTEYRDAYILALRSRHPVAARDAKMLLDDRDAPLEGLFARNCTDDPKQGDWRVLVCGAGRGAQAFTSSVADLPVHIVGYLDDDWERLQAAGAPVLGPLARLEYSIIEMGVRDVVFAIPTAPGFVRRAALDSCRRAMVRMHDLPSRYKHDPAVPLVRQLAHPVPIDRLIGRRPRAVDREASFWLRNLRVLVVGADSALGAEICRRAAQAGSARVVAHDQWGRERVALRRHAQQRPVGHGKAAIDNTDLLFDVVFLLFEAWLGSDETARAEEVTRVVATASEHLASGASVTLVEPYVRDSAATRTQRKVEHSVVGLRNEGFPGKVAAVRVGETLRGPEGPLTQMDEAAAVGEDIIITGPVRRRLLTIERACELVLRAAEKLRSGETAMTNAGEEFSLDQVARVVADYHRRLGDVASDIVRLDHDGPAITLLSPNEIMRPAYCCADLALVGHHVLYEA